MNGRVKVLSGVAGTSTAETVRHTREVEKLGADNGEFAGGGGGGGGTGGVAGAVQ